MIESLITDPTKPVQGCALYAEFINTTTKSVKQIFFTPDGTDETGNHVVASYFERAISEVTPKRQWSSIKLRSQLTHPEYTNAQVRYWRTRYIRDSIDRLANPDLSWALNGKPFYVEVSKKDLTDIRNGKTPTKVIYRIGQTRTANNYPELFTK